MRIVSAAREEASLEALEDAASAAIGGGVGLSYVSADGKTIQVGGGGAPHPPHEKPPHRHSSPPPPQLQNREDFDDLLDALDMDWKGGGPLRGAILLDATDRASSKGPSLTIVTPPFFF
jgi:hypothetical protein